MRYYCNQCGQVIAFGPGVCSRCQARLDKQERAAEAQERAARAQTYAANVDTIEGIMRLQLLHLHEMERQIEHERKAEQERLADITHNVGVVASWPDKVKARFAIHKHVTRTAHERLALLGELEALFRPLTPDDWRILHEHEPLQMEVAYARLRKLLRPYILGMWKIRDTLSPSPAKALQTLAGTFLYVDLGAIRVANKELPEALKQTVTAKRLQTATKELRHNTDQLSSSIEDQKRIRREARIVAARIDQHKTYFPGEMYLWVSAVAGGLFLSLVLLMIVWYVGALVGMVVVLLLMLVLTQHPSVLAKQLSELMEKERALCKNMKSQHTHLLRVMEEAKTREVDFRQEEERMTAVMVGTRRDLDLQAIINYRTAENMAHP